MRQSQLHEDLSREDAVVGSSDRGFGLTCAGMAALVGALRLVFGHAGWGWWWLAAVAFLALAMLRPAWLAPLNRLWLWLGLKLYKIVNPVVMAMLFLTTIVPLGLVMRALGKDPLRLRRDRTADSYWLVRDPPGPAPDTMRNQF